MTSRQPESGWVQELQSLAQAADPGPWLVGHADDPMQMSASFVAMGRFKRSSWPPSDRIVAVTFLQSPNLAMPRQEEANAAFIAASRDGVPKLCDEVKRLLGQRDRCRATLRKLVHCAAAHLRGGDDIEEGLVEEAGALLAELEAG